jgi:hypothetical protein
VLQGWLTPVILATQEAEIRRIEIRRIDIWSQPVQMVQETYLEKILWEKKKNWLRGSSCRP